MKSSKWRYKDYYERHKEQEKQRTNAYYHEHRDEILAKRREKRRQQPKKVRLTPVDYQEMWRDLKVYMEANGFVGVYEFMLKLEKTQVIFKEYYKQEMFERC